jgi:hypothetical protein
MRKALVFLPLLLLPVSAWAQQPIPKVEVFGGYSNLTANLNGSSFNLNGFDVSVAENMNKWFGGALDVSSHYGTEAGFNINTQSFAYGPVFSYRKNPKIVPFGHALFGAVRGGPEYLNISKPEFRFGMYAGGGLDVKVANHLALRLIQADYLLTRFSGARQDNIRVSAGIVLLLGKK